MAIKMKQVPALQVVPEHELTGKAVAPAQAEVAQEISPEQQLKLLVDEVAELQIEADALMDLPVFKKLAEKVAEVRKLADEKFAADQAGLLVGFKHAIDVTAKKVSSSLPEANREAAIQAMTAEVWAKLATPSITELRKYLSKPQQDKLILSVYSGARTLKFRKL